MKRREALKNTALLGGSTVLTGALVSLLQACQQTSRIDWKPQFLSIEHAEMVAAFVDTILPRTATPGALDMKVDMFIDLAFAKMYDEAGQKKLTEELTKFNQESKDTYGKGFADLDQAQKEEFLMEKEKASPKFGYSVWGAGVGPQPDVGFYRSIKSMAIMGFCTSEEIGKNVLKYDPVPGEFLGCIPLSDVDGVWSI